MIEEIPTPSNVLRIDFEKEYGSESRISSVGIKEFVESRGWELQILNSKLGQLSKGKCSGISKGKDDFVFGKGKNKGKPRCGKGPVDASTQPWFKGKGYACEDGAHHEQNNDMQWS